MVLLWDHIYERTIAVKRLLLVVGAMLVLAPSAFATATSTYSGVSSGNNKPFVVYVTTLRAGDLSVRADWNPSGNTQYVLRVQRQPHLSGVFDYCDVGVTAYRTDPGLTTSPASCTVTNAPAGTYYVDFRGLNGKTAVALTVTGETDPQ